MDREHQGEAGGGWGACALHSEAGAGPPAGEGPARPAAGMAGGEA